MFVRSLAASLLLLLFASLASAAERPNILFAFADDWGRYASVYRDADHPSPNDVFETPHFDRVAREGALFTNAFVTAPSCTPCRSSLLSGQYFYRTGRGAILQGAVWDTEIPTYPLLLEKNGYHIGHTYKVWSPGTPANAGAGGGRTAFGSAGRRFNGFSQFVSRQKDVEAAKQTLYDEVRGNFEAFLAKRDEGQPFCYWFGPTNVHRKWIAGSGKKLWGIDPDDLEGKLPPFLPDVPVVREDFADYLGEVKAFDESLGVLLAKLEEMGELDNTLIVVSGDHGAPGFPRGKCNLYDFGVGVALAIRPPAVSRAGAGLRPKPKPSREGADTKSATEQRTQPPQTITDFVNLMDLAPTFCEAGGVEPPEVMTGRSLLPVLKSAKSGRVDASRDFVVVGRERHVASARPGMLPYPQRAIRTDDYLYVRNFEPDRWPMGVGPGMGAPAGEWPSYEKMRENTTIAFGDLDASPTKAWIAEHREDDGMEPFVEWAFGRRPGEELYDLRDDPHQIRNLADDPAHAEAKARLSKRLMTILRETGDPRVTGDGSTFEKPPYTGPFRR